jgi:hypothetical protein
MGDQAQEEIGRNDLWRQNGSSFGMGQVGQYFPEAAPCIPGRDHDQEVAEIEERWRRGGEEIFGDPFEDRAIPSEKVAGDRHKAWIGMLID